MDITQQGVVTLLRSAITGEKLPLPEEFDLEGAYPELKKHHMDAMLYDGAVRCGISKKLPVMQELFQKYCRALWISEGQMRQLERIFAAFEANGIDYMPLKGSKIKALYPKPELRYMGDADILIRLEQRREIKPIMESLGFQQQKETDHEWIWTHPQLFVELHKHLIPSYNEDFYGYFGNGWQLAVNREGCRCSVRAEDELLFLFTHFTKHYRDGGIGCRYVADLWMYLRANPQLDQSYLQAELEKLGLQEFYRNILRLMRVWFESLPSDEKMDFITDFIFASGSWGNGEVGIVSVGLRERGKKGSARSKLFMLRSMAFPNVGVLRDKYPVLKNAPWLLPAVWLYRPFYKAARERDSLKKHREELRQLTPENLQTRQDALNYVGLDYHL